MTGRTSVALLLSQYTSYLCVLSVFGEMFYDPFITFDLGLFEKLL